MSVDQATPGACCGTRIPGVGGAPLVNACQLCPTSPTYWRNQPLSEPAPTATAPATVEPERPAGLDWSSHKAGDGRPCRICRKPAFIRDATGVPCHKVCAEQAGEEQQPASAAPALRLIEGGKR